jgi:hypothetical protein
VPGGVRRFRDGDFLVRGKTINDPAVIGELNQHIGKADD